MAPDFDHLMQIQKLEVFEYALDNTTGQDFYRVLWLKSRNSEAWLDRRSNYCRTLAVMSMVGHILGLGDRHPSNLLMDRVSGKIVHVDFGDCFEVAMQREVSWKHAKSFFPRGTKTDALRLLLIETPGEGTVPPHAYAHLGDGSVGHRRDVQDHVPAHDARPARKQRVDPRRARSVRPRPAHQLEARARRSPSWSPRRGRRRERSRRGSPTSRRRNQHSRRFVRARFLLCE